MSAKSKGTCVPNGGTCVPCEREIASERMFAFLRELYPHNTLAHVAADLGVSIETVAKWRTRKSLPEALTCLRMMFLYRGFFECVAPEISRAMKDKIAHDQKTLCDLTDL